MSFAAVGMLRYAAPREPSNLVIGCPQIVGGVKGASNVRIDA